MGNSPLVLNFLGSSVRGFTVIIFKTANRLVSNKVKKALQIVSCKVQRFFFKNNVIFSRAKNFISLCPE